MLYGVDIIFYAVYKTVYAVDKIKYAKYKRVGECSFNFNG